MGVMIGRISGKVIGKTGDGALLIDVGGLGYRVRVMPEVAQRIGKATGEATLFTHLAVREDALDLYGFETDAELRFFEQLIGISGIGPKSALGILSLGDVETLEGAIAAGDSSYLTKVSGIGKKSAERIVVELRDKLNAGGKRSLAHDVRGDAEALEALQGLGYGMNEAREALKAVSKETLGVSERLREALKLLGK